ncbi:MAG: archaeosine biosynthesis radical SAM protein RaSEA [Candidatus Thorarchaeota archaeon]
MSEEFEEIRELVAHESLASRGSSIVVRRRRNPRRPASVWSTQSLIGDTVGTAFSIVLSTVGCSYARSASGGCTMCSYLLDGTGGDVSSEDLVAQFRNAMSKTEGIEAPLSVKVYTSGSFLDDAEVSSDARREILRIIATDQRVQHVVLESRPEYATEPKLRETRDILGERDVELGMGLESSNDRVRLVCVNKGFTREEFRLAVELAKQHGIGTRAYVLIKPPFLSEGDALADAVNTIIDAANMGATTVSVNPVNVQRHTLVERLWDANAYRPPWLWTVVEVLTRARRKIPNDVLLVCDPVAAGKKRGAHNCGLCDSTVTQAIRRFSLTQDPDSLANLDCSCRSLWLHALKHEALVPIVHDHRLD